MTAVIAEDLRVFSDLGTDFHVFDAEDGATRYLMTLDAKPATITIAPDGAINLAHGNQVQNFANIQSLLSDPKFGDLRRWASQQATLLHEYDSFDAVTIDGELVVADIPDERRNLPSDQFADFLAELTDHELDVIVLDGPAGIGKTTQIKRIAQSRAAGFTTLRRRLLLHVESTGRALQNLDDLIAGSLQRIRARPTYDQLRVLVKHGLITLVIDGFDELTDASGYQLAWSQVRALLDAVRGQGQVILSGRETFISLSQLKTALPILDTHGIRTIEYRLIEVTPDTAKQWLIKNGIRQENLDRPQMLELLSTGSYGLRPFFLARISESAVVEAIDSSTEIDLLSILIDALIRREQGKFGEDISQKIGADRLGQYVRAVSEEIARDMADNQSEVLPNENISWISDMCLPADIDQNLRATLINRAGQLPFLTPDQERQTTRFAHRQFFVSFLGSNAVRAVAQGEVPKYLRRNLLGPEFLESFPTLLRALPADLVKTFRDSAFFLGAQLGSTDRGSGNLAALALAAACEYPPAAILEMRYVYIETLYLRGEVPSIELKAVNIGTLHAESADLSKVCFLNDCKISALHVDKFTKCSKNIPLPVWLELPGKTLYNPKLIAAHLQGVNEPGVTNTDIPFDRELLYRIQRYRPFWLRIDDDNLAHSGRKILDHPDWEKAFEWLEANDLVRVDERPEVSGSRATFVHFRQNKLSEL